MSLGKNILALRKNHGLSQEQLGEKINVSRQTISNWEIGETSPNSEQLRLLSKELNVSIDELLNNDSTTESKQELSISQEILPKKMSVWQILFLILGSPIWLSLLITIFVIIISIYIVMWSVVISFWAIFVSIVCVALSMILLGIPFAFINVRLTGIAMISIGIMCIGLSILLFFGCKLVTKAILLLTGKSIELIKRSFQRKEVTQ